MTEKSFNEKFLSLQPQNSYLSLNQDVNDHKLNFDNNKKVLYDPIHKHMELDKYLFQIIDTEPFQRLRRIKQLSLTYMVFPGATHTRFEHCIGTGYLANDLVNNCFDKINIEEKDKHEMEYLKKCVTIAGLCHDIGHGPFSHLFDSILSTLNLKDIKFDHEDFGGQIIKKIIDDYSIDFIDTNKFNKIKEIITGKTNKYKEYDFVYQIVANKYNGIDIDKFDYILRDIYHTGISTSCIDYKRIFQNINIIDNNICFQEKTMNDISNLFRSRLILHQKVYKNPKVILIESMLLDALKLSNKYFRFEESITDINKFLKLDDSIITTMLNFSNELDEDELNPSLLKAEELIKKIYNRNLYKFLGPVYLPYNFNFNKEKEISNFISNKNPKDDYYISKDDIELFETSFDYGFKEKNPFDEIYFYNPSNPNTKFRELNKLANDLSMPNIFKEKVIMVILKNPGKYNRGTKLFEIYKNNLKKNYDIKENQIDNKNNNEFIIKDKNSTNIETNINDLLNKKSSRKNF